MITKSGRKTIWVKIPSKPCRYPAGQNFVKIALACSVSEIKTFKNFVKIALAHTVSEMSTIFAFSAKITSGRKTQKFKMAAKSNFAKSHY